MCLATRDDKALYDMCMTHVYDMCMLCLPPIYAYSLATCCPKCVWRCTWRRVQVMGGLAVDGLPGRAPALVYTRLPPPLSQSAIGDI